MSNDNCSDYGCEWPGENEHSHVGPQKYLRKVMDHGILIDGLTGELIDAAQEPRGSETLGEGVSPTE